MTPKQIHKEANKIAGSLASVLRVAQDAHGDPAVLRAAADIARGFSEDQAEQPIIDACVAFWEQRAEQMERVYRETYGRSYAEIEADPDGANDVQDRHY